MDGQLGEGLSGSPLLSPQTTPRAPIAKLKHDCSRMFQYYLDKSTPLPTQRWLGTLALVFVYFLRVHILQGFYAVTYGIGIHVINCLIGFLSPQIDPEMESMDGADLPTKETDEFRPFIRRLPEFKFWYSITKAFCIGFLLTFFPIFDVPVFWPILLCYWIIQFLLMMKRHIMHMIKYKYIPLDLGKQKYVKSSSPVGSPRRLVELCKKYTGNSPGGSPRSSSGKQN
ncbi:protein RER1B [Daucus carota subsp. sativus]|uniref:Protein RER1 n=1 Tax=Daucus carota subsp. sativus TaxID=79200 RepID=A0A164VD01_DAUCS|nr:PREDICTED: protein RER1B-like [Daucus carota subsp. sativus]